MAGGRSVVSWFPGHMHKALKFIEQRMKLVDLVVEIRDARVPFSSASPEVARLGQHKRRLLLLNKTDMADPASTKVLDAALGWLRAERPQSDLSLILIAGMPNTGKSSLINALKRAAKRQDMLEGEQAFHKTARAGPLPGVTTQVGGFKVCDEPQVYVLDTPGVLPPAIRDPRVAERLALTGLIPAAGPGGMEEGALLRRLLQVVPPGLGADGGGDRRRSRGGSNDGGAGSGDGGGIGDQRRAAKALSMARALYDVVSLPPPEARHGAQAWHPGLEDLEEDEGDSPGSESQPPQLRRRVRAPLRPPSPEAWKQAPGWVEHGGRDLGWEGGELGEGPGAAVSPAEVAAAVFGRGSEEETELRVAELLRRLARGTAVDAPGRRAALTRSVLEAFRKGALGRYTLDEVA
ncbi:hypothetical protein GPECTOR_250g621 [Gonium pectorale]|uniref:G domain-containing protein n=1 Tax=Gonium pectorale TaxID=33097 RepID=A0A150FW98_GONPE|nr:hypothetical protein GPECTOR_250g621 [Gonium pectorale]|eukprot:KXZ41893.1 hypothetical protein GPECTOR_250g621 [Gonium pectorale]